MMGPVEAEISKYLRRDLSWLVGIGYPPCCSTRWLHHFWRQLSSQHSLESLNSFLISVEALKQRIVSYAAPLRKYNARYQCFKQNSLFCSNERAFYSGLLKRNDVVPLATDISQLKSFWTFWETLIELFVVEWLAIPCQLKQVICGWFSWFYYALFCLLSLKIA